jgi:hypothetical protein
MKERLRTTFEVEHKDGSIRIVKLLDPLGFYVITRYDERGSEISGVNLDHHEAELVMTVLSFYGVQPRVEIRRGGDEGETQGF